MYLQKKSNLGKDLPVAANILPDPDLSSVQRSNFGHLEDSYQEALMHKLFTTRTEYENLLAERIRTSPTMKTMFRNHGYGDDTPKYMTELRLKYYDKETVMFSFPSENGSRYFYVYDIHTLDKISKVTTASLYTAESKNYIIFVISRGDDINPDSAEHLLFYKKGARDFQKVPNSDLIEPETYGAGSLSDGLFSNITIDDSTGMLTASVFNENEFTREHPQQKRITQFKLP